MIDAIMTHLGYYKKFDEENIKQETDAVDYTWVVHFHDGSVIAVQSQTFDEDDRGFMFRDTSYLGVAYFPRDMVKCIIQQEATGE